MGVRVPSPAPIQTSSGYSNYRARLSLSPRPFLVLEILTIQQKLYESCFNSVAEVARILDVSIKRSYRKAAKGQIPSLKISNSIRFDPPAIAIWLRSQYQSHSAVLPPSLFEEKQWPSTRPCAAHLTEFRRHRMLRELFSLP